MTQSSAPTKGVAMIHTVQFVDADGDSVTAEFETSAQAWSFMRLCDSHGVSAGFPYWR